VSSSGRHIQPAANRGQAFGAGRAQRAQEEGLGLIVAMLGQGQAFVVPQRTGERLPPRVPRRAFGAQSAVAAHLDLQDFQCHAPGRAQVATVFGPGVGIAMQPVMHVQCPQPAFADGAVRRQPVQQCGGIQTAAHGQRHRQRRQRRGNQIERVAEGGGLGHCSC
jgi:hypothetical protein